MQNYFWRYWQPLAAGLYKIQVEVHPIHKDNKGVTPTDIATRGISVGVNLIDFTDTDYALAYNPDTKVGAAAVRISDITPAGPTVYYTNPSYAEPPVLKLFSA